MYHVYAQENVLESDPLRARKLLVYDQIGVYAGPSFNGQGGKIVTDCLCEFTGGAQTGYAFGALFERLTRSRLIWGFALGFEDKGVEGRFTEIEGVVQQSPSTGARYTVPITFNNSAVASIGYVTAMPYLKYDFFKILFVRAGVPLSYIVSSNLKYTKSLVSDSVTFPNGEVATASIPGTTNGSIVLQDGPLKNIKSFQAGISLAAGLEVGLSRTLYLSPVIQYIQPLTNVNSTGGGFSVRSLQIFLECRLII
ncbi:MAG: outer membrane beta-barrel protein [Ignavibacteria bacterium]|nr:outer membrane beta-barrel protein [Ignavibacteria bacterium]